jgi:hypothetical protein
MKKISISDYAYSWDTELDTETIIDYRTGDYSKRYIFIDGTWYTDRRNISDENDLVNISEIFAHKRWCRMNSIFSYDDELRFRREVGNEEQ